MPEAPAVRVYRRQGCHLCDEASEMLAEIAAGRGGLALDEVDIESDDDLLATYLERIPVIAIDGVIVSELVPDRDAILRALGTFEK